MRYFDVYYCDEYMGRHVVRADSVEEGRSALRRQLTVVGYNAGYLSLYEVDA